MNQEHAYRHDFEELLLKKHFSELSADEKAFVLELVSGEEDYQSMRQTLLSVQREIKSGTSLKPRPGIKDALLAKLAAESDHKVVPIGGKENSGKGKVFKWWIPAGIAAAVMFGWMLLFDQQEIPVGQLAEKVERNKTEETTKEVEEPTEEVKALPAPESAVMEDEEISLEEAPEEQQITIVDAMQLDVPEEEPIGEDLAELEERSPEVSAKTYSSQPAMTESIELTFSNTESLSSSPAFNGITTDNVTFLDLSPVSASSQADMFSYLYTAW